MASWVRTITSPFRKGCIFFNQSKEKKHNQQGHGHPRGMDLHDEVMACAYEDVRVMWSILDKSEPRACNVSS
ncbi:hypothetical protein MRB53_019059 [Persea americana]|uniref:Uncharacterized protein n=1 Tax=Persea americana TaxID=3435 RepID=A0ACC2M9N1_PERAE|nr:hypothetical protein MRB53_019059 [Persea americana]